MGPGEEDDRCVSSNFGDKVGGVCITLGAKDREGLLWEFSSILEQPLNFLSLNSTHL